MVNNGSLITVPRLIKAWEPNINNGILYYKLESAIMRYLYMYRNIGAFVQLGEDLNTAPLVDKMCIKPENCVGYITDINDDSVVINVASDMIDLVRTSLDTCRVGFMYTITDAQDQMGDIRIMKPILYLNPIAGKRQDVS